MIDPLLQNWTETTYDDDEYIRLYRTRSLTKVVWTFFLLFCSTNGKSESIGIPDLIDFLNEKQRDPRLNEILYPHYNATRVKEIISTYEPDQELVKQGKTKKERNPSLTYVSLVELNLKRLLAHSFSSSSYHRFLVSYCIGNISHTMSNF